MIAPLFFAMACLGQADALPVVREEYDCIAVACGDWPRAYFLRRGRIIATRACVNDWSWEMKDGKLTACWEDYGTCRREVSCKSCIWGWTPPPSEDPSSPWWNQARIMTDLAAPPEEK